MRVIIACEYSGIVREAFKAKGHDALSCDLLPTEIPGYHWEGDIFECLKFHHYGFDLMIAFPPCTHLAVSGARHFEKKKKDGRQKEGIDFFMDIINQPIKKIAVENPVGIMSNIYRKPDQVIQPYYFGDTERKTTCLWLKNLPKLFHAKDTDLFNSKITHVEIEYYETKTGNKYTNIHNGMGYGWNTDECKKARSKTFQGIADAMAEQWG